CAPQLRAFAYW
nr:immunoglobulin heavy chain junction region [Mus musculus]MBK4184697.1 immunoglobulin heavy chain junction region [Mus musculus]MBK4184866.1 immunoglobulin heavy chain junction region [Mus musculus]MBK4185820.1 immunoglobulin heavy chain junction region [Mus musculus]MBK4186824.1 immunoglobulin heavy chain junction region [Mus musculus]